VGLKADAVQVCFQYHMGVARRILERRFIERNRKSRVPHPFGHWGAARSGLKSDACSVSDGELRGGAAVALTLQHGDIHS
jgi:hypothetical protein